MSCLGDQEPRCGSKMGDSTLLSGRFGMCQHQWKSSMGKYLWELIRACRITCLNKISGVIYYVIDGRQIEFRILKFLSWSSCGVDGVVLLAIIFAHIHMRLICHFFDLYSLLQMYVLQILLIYCAVREFYPVINLKDLFFTRLHWYWQYSLDYRRCLSCCFLFCLWYVYNV